MKASALTIKLTTISTAVFLCSLCCAYFTFAVLMIYFHGTETQTTFRELILTFIHSLETEDGSIRELVLALVAGILYVCAAILVIRSGNKLIAETDKKPAAQVVKSLFISLAWSISGILLFFPWFGLLNRLIILQQG